MALLGTLPMARRCFFAAAGPRDGSARGGHLFEATVRPTAELVRNTYPKPVRRKIHSEWDLPLLAP